MSDQKNVQAEETYTSKLDILMVQPQGYAALIEAHANTPRAVVTAVGMPGLGKTAIPKQVAKRRNAPYMAIHVPTELIEDLGIPTTASDTKEYYDKRISRKFQPLITFVAKLRAENGGNFPEGRNPILAIEELNRASDKHITRAMFTLIEDRRIGDVHIDEAIQIIVTMNPSGGSMAVNEFERDPAARRRLVMCGITASTGDFLRYAKEAKFHADVVSHLEAQPNWLYDNDALKAGKKFACPSAWETVSQSCIEFEKKGLSLTGDMAMASFAGTIGATAATALVDFLRDATVVITPEEVFENYHENSTVRKRVEKIINESRMDKLTVLQSGIAIHLFLTEKKPAAFVKQLALFMLDLPVDANFALIKEMVEQSKNSNNGKAKLTEANQLLANEKAYNDAMEKLKRSQDKANDTAKNEGIKK